MMHMKHLLGKHTTGKCRQFWNVSSGGYKVFGFSQKRNTSINHQHATNRLKELWKTYGTVAIGTYLSTYVVVLASFYGAMEYGIINKATPANTKENEADFSIVETTNRFVELAEKLGIADAMDVQRVNSRTGTFLLAWVATKFTEPLRLAFTIAITPRLARLLKRA